MTRITMLVLVSVLVAGCQRREHKETTQTQTTTSGESKPADTTVASTPDTVRIAVSYTHLTLPTNREV